MADQLRRDALRSVGGYGRTDALDALASDGVCISGAVTTSPECVPARFALATGLYPHQTCVWRNGPLALAPAAWTWTQELVKAGYRTSLFGKTHLHESAQPSGDLRDGLHLMRGYGILDVDEIAGPRSGLWVRCAMRDLWEKQGLWEGYQRDFAERFATKAWLARPSPLGLDHYYDTYVGRKALDYLAAYDRPEPWCCWVSFAGPHEPWDAPAPYDRLHAPADAPAPIPRVPGAEGVRGLLHGLFRSPDHSPPLTASDVAALRANYAGNVTLIDTLIGNILECIKARGWDENTLIVATSDHGEMNGDHGLLYKSNFLASAVDIPLIVRPPSGHAADKPAVGQALAELIDVGPTILDYAGLPAPDWIGGRSLRPLIEGRTPVHRPYVVSELAEHTMVANDRWKCEFDPDGAPALLFDRPNDPFEQQDLVDDPGSELPLRLVRAMLQDHRDRTSLRKDITA